MEKRNVKNENEWSQKIVITTMERNNKKKNIKEEN